MQLPKHIQAGFEKRMMLSVVLLIWPCACRWVNQRLHGLSSLKLVTSEDCDDCDIAEDDSKHDEHKTLITTGLALMLASLQDQAVDLHIILGCECCPGLPIMLCA